MNKFTASSVDKVYFSTTLCWRCPTVYPITDESCPHCHATNANFDSEKAIVEMAAFEATDDARN